MKKIILFWILVFSSLTYAGDMSWLYEDKSSTETKEIKIIPSECVRPIKLKLITTKLDVNHYNNALHQYTKCINIFIKKQEVLANSAEKKDIRLIHITSIEKATADLKSYDRLDDVDQRQNTKQIGRFDLFGGSSDKEEEKQKVSDINNK
jgi:hypothetical protein